MANLLLTVGDVWVALGHRAAGAQRPVLSLDRLGRGGHPLFLVNGIRVANDALGMFLATAAIAGV